MRWCSYCGGDHPVSLCPKTWGGSAGRVTLRCAYCGSGTHATEFCPKTWGGVSNRHANPGGDFLD